jgi:phospholipase C
MKLRKRLSRLTSGLVIRNHTFSSQWIYKKYIIIIEGHGPILPFLIISPFSKVNYVDHETTELTFILKFIEDKVSG